jgi:putative tryptophan/tyrosine transport system substrate-binding protein
MKAKILVYALPALVLATIHLAEAQQPKKVFRIGYLAAGTLSSTASNREVFLNGLREFGYVENKNLVIEYRYAEGKSERLAELAADLIRLKVDVIVTATTPGVLAAKKATSTVPIVFAAVADPVRAGLVSSLARPGGNITGLSMLNPELGGKRLELLKETFPKISRIAYLSGTRTPGIVESSSTAIQEAARALGLQLQSLDVRSAKDFDGAFDAVLKERAQALTTSSGPVININQQRIVDFAAKNRLPAIYPSSEFIDAGGLMFYGVSFSDLFRRAATYVDKILKGANPADLPVEQPTKFEFIINLKTAKQIGLTIPPNVLARADRVIK